MAITITITIGIIPNIIFTIPNISIQFYSW